MLCDAELTYPLNWGSDFNAVAVLRDGLGAVIDLTGSVAFIIDTTAGIGARMTAVVSNAGAGEITLSMPWADMPRGRVNSFRLGWTDAGGADRTFDNWWIDVR
jgi:hypothetical protein